MGRTKAELRDIQADLDEERAIASRKALEEDPRIALLEEDIEAKSIENDALTNTISQLRSEMEKSFCLSQNCLKSGMYPFPTLCTNLPVTHRREREKSVIV